MALRLRGATSGYIELKAPASAGDNTLTLPTNNGSANQLLKTDGSGNLSWTDDNSGVSLSGSTNNTIATVTGANALQGESNLTFDGKKLLVGNTTAASSNSANLVNIDLGGTYLDTAGTTGKLKLYNDGNDEISIGVSNNQFDFILTSTSWSYNFYGGGSGTTKLFQINQTGNNQFLLGNSSSSAQAAPLTVNLGGTYSSADGNGNDLNAKLKLWCDDVNLMGLSVSDSQLEYILTEASYDHVFYGGTAGTTELARIHGDGNIDIANGNLKIGTAGKGIDFSVTSDAGGMTSELLDDYEEGTFTPTFGQGISVSQWSNQVGTYTKIGNLVTCSIYLRSHTSTTDANHMIIANLPYTCNGTTNNEGGGYLKYTNGFFGTTVDSALFHSLPWVGLNTSNVRFHRPSDGQNITGNDCTPDGKYIIFNVQYFVA